MFQSNYISNDISTEGIHVYESQSNNCETKIFVLKCFLAILTVVALLEKYR